MMLKMSRNAALRYVTFVVDDALSGREVGQDAHAFVRDKSRGIFDHSSILVGWQCWSEPLFVAVHSYLDVELSDEEASELAVDFLKERGGWFLSDPTPPDHIIRD